MDTLKVSRVASASVIVGTGWVLLEWLFFVTKPSFMSLYPFIEKLSVLASSAFIISFTLLIVSLPFAALAILASRFVRNKRVLSIVAFFPVILLASLAALVVIDNFTLTLFGWGIRNSTGMTVYLYRLLTLGLWVLAAWQLHGFLDGRISSGTIKSLTITCGVILISSIPLLLMTASKWKTDNETPVSTVQDRPNIVILASDGVSADHMSVYGYERQTTPFMESVRDEFLVAENHFTNASDTGGAIISLLTGKLPTTTKVVYPPDTLRGKDSFEHLPGILKKLGYYNLDISMRHYADPYDLNLRSGFDEANFRQLKQSGGTLVSAIRKYPVLNPSSLLIDRMSERMAIRFEHIWKNKQMPNPLAAVNEPDVRWIRDPKRMEEIRNAIKNSKQPFFLNVHMMGTHGETFRPRERIYSNDADQPVKWSIDGYDDAIIDFDRYVKETYTLLDDSGLLNSTILIISSDHGLRHDALARVPMLLRLPGAKPSGSIPGNTQRLDIAPTILDVLGVQAPGWMEGNSMLSPEIMKYGDRYIFAAGSSSEKSAVGNFWSVSHSVAPWYSLGRLFLIYCNQGFTLKINTMHVEGALIKDSTMDCENPLEVEEAKKIMFTHLREKGYNWD